MNTKKQTPDGDSLYVTQSLVGSNLTSVNLDALMDKGYSTVIDANTDQLLLQIFDSGGHLVREVPIAEDSYDSYMEGATTSVDIIGQYPENLLSF